MPYSYHLYKTNEYSISFHTSSEKILFAILAEKVKDKTEITAVKYDNKDVFFLVKPQLISNSNVEDEYEKLLSKLTQSQNECVPATIDYLNAIITFIGLVEKQINNNLIWEHALNLYMS